MDARGDDSTVLLSDTEDVLPLATELAQRSLPVACYPSVEELLRDRRFSSIAVLVLLFRPLPKGALLATLGRLNLEYPRIQKVMVLDAPPPLPIAEYLTSCRVDLIWCPPGDERSTDRLASVVDRLQRRAGWLTQWSRGDVPWLPAAEEN